MASAAMPKSLTPAEKKMKASQEKMAGNTAFKAGDPAEALNRYSAAIMYSPYDHLLHSNRSMALARLGRWSESEEAAERTVELSSSFMKGYFRLAKAQLEQGKYTEAVQSCTRGMASERRSSGGIRVEPGTSKAAKELEVLAATASERLKAGSESAPPASSGVNGAFSGNRRESGDSGGRRRDSSGRGSAGEPPKPSIKDFKVVEELGTGNFSTIVKAEHRRTGKPFALKMIEKAEVNRLKRRHENVYNEIYMEKRALTKLRHPNIVRMHSTFQDYGTLYYLLDMCDGGEVWKRLTVDGKVVGTHPSLARFWLSEVVSAIEHMHRRGLVHRDLKPENMMLTACGHIKLVDFGTCKDLLETDLNGGEFVGTAQYMSPQAVASEDQGREADLWALGCCAYQFLTGFTPFHAPSPYLCFLRIKDGVFRCPVVLPDDATDLIKRLLRRNPASRLGAGPLTQTPSGTSETTTIGIPAKSLPPAEPPVLGQRAPLGGSCKEEKIAGEGRGEGRGDASFHSGSGGDGGGFEALRAHPFFEGQEFVGDGQPLPPAVTVPKLFELCVRAVAHHLVDYADATALIREPFPTHADVHRLHREAFGVATDSASGNNDRDGGGGCLGIPGDDGDVRRTRQREFVERVRHYLGRLRVLQRPKVSRLFYSSVVDAKCLKADPIMREYLGLDWDSHGHWNKPFFFAQIADPLLGVSEAMESSGGAVWEKESGFLTRAVGIVNRLRPKFLLVTGNITDASPTSEFYEGQVTAARQILAKVSETIPVLYCPGDHDVRGAGHGSSDADESEYVKRFGADYYSFWWGGVRGLVLNTNLWASRSASPERRRAQERWLNQELEVAQLNAHHLIIVGHHPWFLEDPYEDEHSEWTPIPRDVRLRWLAKMGRCKVKFVFSGHCRRNYAARLRRPIEVPKRTPNTVNADINANTIGNSEARAVLGTPRASVKPVYPDSPPSSAAAVSCGEASSGGGDQGPATPVSQKGKASNASKTEGVGNESGAEQQRTGGGSSGGEEVIIATGAHKGDVGSGRDSDSDDGPASMSDSEDDEVLDEIDLRSVVTSSCSAPLGPEAAPPGFRLIRVFSRRIENDFFTLDSPPVDVDLTEEF